MTPQQAWEQVYHRFDPTEFGVPTPRWRAERPDSPIPDLTADLDWPAGRPRFALLGTEGSGKTTELRRVLEAQGPSRLAIFFDISQHFARVASMETINRVQPWEHLFLAGLVVWRAGKERGLLDEADLDQLGAAREAIIGHPTEGTRLDLAKAAGSLSLMIGAGTGALVAGPAGAAVGLTVGGMVKELLASASVSLNLGGSDVPRLPNDDARATGILAAVNRMLLKIDKSIRVVLVLDGLDRVRELSVAEGLFLDDALLGQLECRLVVSGPLTLRRRGRLGRFKGFTPVVLTEVAVLDHRDPWSSGSGVTFFQELWRLRIAGLPQGSLPEAARERGVTTDALPVGFEPGVLERLAHMSGGRLREFISLVREVAPRAYKAGVDTVPAAIVDRIIDSRRRLVEEGLHAGYRALLDQIAAHPEELPDPPPRIDGRDYVDDLLQNFWVLAYPNESAWFFPHPLLTLKKILKKPPPPGT